MDGELQGSFTASSSRGGFWRRKFRAIHLTSVGGEVIGMGSDSVSFTPSDEYRRPKPTRYPGPRGELERPAGERREGYLRHQISKKHYPHVPEQDYDLAVVALAAGITGLRIS